MKRIEEVLQESTSQYRAILEHGAELAGGLEQSRPRGVREHCGRLAALQEEARRTDQVLAHLLQAADEGVGENPLFRERLQLMEQILERNSLLVAKAKAMQSALSAELSQVRGAMTAMAGYKGGPEGRGSILNGAY